jgi:hypothetical protein
VRRASSRNRKDRSSCRTPVGNCVCACVCVGVWVCVCGEGGGKRGGKEKGEIEGDERDFRGDTLGRGKSNPSGLLFTLSPRDPLS